MKILFLHGWNSVPGGVKPSWLIKHGHEVLNPSLDDNDFAAAVATAQAEYDAHQPDVIVGSSRGGAVAMNIHVDGKPLVLLCPAWKKWGAATAISANSTLIHSRADDVVPFAHSEELIRNSGLPATSLLEVGTDHRLADPEPLAAMLAACEKHAPPKESLLDHPAISGRYLFPQPRRVRQPFLVPVDGAELACYRHDFDADALTLVHFHGNGEAVADYLPDMAEALAAIGLNSLFVEYRQYGGSTGKAQLTTMLGDGEVVLQEAGLEPGEVIALGRSIGSLYAIELAHRLPSLGGLILESGIADPGQRFLLHGDLAAAGLAPQQVLAEVERHFNHQRKMAGYQGPLLVLHTENDGLVDIDHAERNYAWAGSTKKQLVRFPRGNHNSILAVNRREYLAAVKQFAGEIRG
ncbi:alpha/beta hydrolase [Lignipirellula cremea]|uniref:Alpha/beta hydrolase family protein n=1 Tax=Lignipirellula cremea TaxID=2528010 RepID=A0A518DVS5_9BACT|nr:alpha/beta hydrolase [Lignipirellula cremea]QDU95935.1 Alpha/beta hydrolase family protein [Lignipirellula cremea]